MNPTITEPEARALLDKVARASKARAILATRPSYAIRSLISSLVTGAGIFAIADFSAPLSVKILIIIGFVFGVIGQIDAWILQRRLEAAVELLQQRELPQ